MNHAEKLCLEQVLFPILGENGLDFLEPQTSFRDSDGKERRIDFTLQSRFKKYALEIDGYTYHAEGAITREKFSDQLFRQNELQNQDYKIYRFSYDDILHNPERCQTQLRRAILADDELNPLLQSLEIKPNIPQEKALTALQETRNAGKTKGLVVLATGIGKTYLAAFDAKRFCAPTDGKVLFLVHNTEILRQSADKFSNVWSDASTGLYYSTEKTTDAQILFASMQTMSKDNHQALFDPTHFDYIIIDESHRTPTASYKKILAYFKPKFLLGITATPDRLDEQEILPFYENNLVFEMGQREAIDSGFLVPFKYYGLNDNIDYSNIRYSGYKYNVQDLDKLLMIDNRDNAVIQKFRELASGKRGIGFCVSIKHAERCAKKFKEAGFSAVAIHSKMDKEERDSTVLRFRNGEIQLAFVRDIFNEGVDFPDIETLLFLRPTESKTIFIQQLGRGLRLSPRKEAVTVLDFIGNYKKAGKVRDYLEGLNTNDEQTLDKDGKPEYQYPYGCEVKFDEEVIELFKEQETITKEDLLNNYIRVKDALGRQPTITDINQNGDYTAHYYLQAFGTWNKFLESVGEVGNLNKEILTKTYFEVKEKIGRIPTKKDMDDNCDFNSGAYQKFWGTWRKFLASIGEITYGGKLNTEVLIKEYHDLKKKLGHQPTKIEIDNFAQYSSASYQTYFGTWKKFLASIGEIKLYSNYDELLSKRKKKRKKGVRRATDEELIADYHRVKNILGRQPTRNEYQKNGEYASGTILNRWGSWSDFLTILGDASEYQNSNFSEDELIENYKRVRDELGKIPTIKQLKELGKVGIHHYQRCFGSYKEFLKQIGEKTVQEQLADEYIKVKEKLGRQPNAKEFSGHSNSTWNTISRYFGSWNEFLIAVGEKPLTERRTSRANKRNISKQDLIDAYFLLKESLGRQPDSSDMRDHGEFSLTSYVNHYGSWNNFLNEISEPILKEVKPVTKAELIATYYELKEKLGRIPKGVDMDNHGKYSAGVYFKKFGGWNNFLESIGEKSIKNQEELR
jgi:superfamily II DNA or RNA helicase